MSDFLLELLSEEIPARMQPRARADLQRMMAESLQSAGLGHGAITAFSTPRRLALIVRDVAAETEAASEELKGPKTGAPPQALDGFLRKAGVTRDQLEDRGGTWFARIERPGRAASDIIAEAVGQIIADFPWPKSMRWGDGELRWVRPLHSIVALLGADIVPVAVAGITSGATTLGHRFHHPGPITIGGATDYAEKLRACHVLVDQEEREALIRDGAAKAAAEAGLTLIEDEGLVVENAGLTEWPVPLLGRFDPDFLDVPREVIVLTMRTNQKYFACSGEDGALAPAFVCIANIDANDGGAGLIEGNRRVLAARLADARFFWEQDVKTSLIEKLEKLEEVVFHERLGRFSEKTYRIADLAERIVEMGFLPGDAKQVRLTAELSKADLTSGMVGEFPELQGIIGGHLARAQGEPTQVWEAIRDHYRPLGPNDSVPSQPETLAISIADKIDNLSAFFSIGEIPTGSKDPFALRRAALGLIRLIVENELKIPLRWLAVNSATFVWSSVELERQDVRDAAISDALRDLGVENVDVRSALEAALDQKELQGSIEGSSAAAKYYQTILQTPENVVNFVIDRLKVQQREAGVRHDLIDAVFALGGEDDLVRLLARVKALQAFVETEDGTDLLAGYKRAANILKKEKWEEGAAGTDDVAVEEAALTKALDKAEPKATTAIEKEDFTAAMAALASLRGPIDAFFDAVKVNADDKATRARRLSLLARFRDAVNRVADFSKIEG